MSLGECCVVRIRCALQALAADRNQRISHRQLVTYFGVSVTNADLIMADGKSLEHTGVTPDELLLPTPEDMAARRDPVLAHAASLVGVKLDPEEAGAFIFRKVEE